MIGPREGKLARLYVQLNEVSNKGGRSAPLEITPALILGVAKKILRPYTLDFKYLDWWSVYRVSLILPRICFARAHVTRFSKESLLNSASQIGMLCPTPELLLS